MPRYPIDLGRQNPDCTANRHGTAWAYNKAHCRCPAACKAWALYRKRRSVGTASPLRFDPTGTHRRIRALMRLGHSSATIAAAAGLHQRQISQILLCTTYVVSGTEAAIRRAYDRLSMTEGVSNRTRSRAVAAGWPPPLAWDENDIDDPAAEPYGGEAGLDDLAVDEVLAGRMEFSRLAEQDRAAAVLALHGEGLTVNAIRARLGTSQHVVTRLLRLYGPDADTPEDGASRRMYPSSPATVPLAA